MRTNFITTKLIQCKLLKAIKYEMPQKTSKANNWIKLETWWNIFVFSCKANRLKQKKKQLEARKQSKEIFKPTRGMERSVVQRSWCLCRCIIKHGATIIISFIRGFQWILDSIRKHNRRRIWKGHWNLFLVKQSVLVLLLWKTKAVRKPFI